MKTDAPYVAAMSRALELAARGPQVDPNPRVGCVILDELGDLVGEGWHQGAGTDHAEVMAIRQAGERARGGTALVTLEPCKHTGRTGPCVEALKDAGIIRVVYAAPDPTAEASGGGEALKDAGLQVRGGFMQGVAERLNEVWATSMKLGRPYVTWKYAMTADGFSAASDRTSRWITGEKARAHVHRMRSECGAILVGTGTVLNDNPRLTIRTPDSELVDRQPLRVVMGLRPIPSHYEVHSQEALTWFTGTRDVDAVMQGLFERGIRHAWVEGGPQLAGHLIDAGVIDRIITYVAPAMLGHGLPVVHQDSPSTMERLRRGTIDSVVQCGDDVRIIWHLKEPSPERSE